MKELIINKYIKENVRHRTFNCCLTQSPRIFFLVTTLIRYPTTEENHPVGSLDNVENYQKTTFFGTPNIDFTQQVSGLSD